MRFILTIVSCACFSIWFKMAVLAEELDWGKKAEEILLEVQNKQYLEAKEDVKQLSDSFTSSNFANEKLKIEAVQVLSSLLVELDRGLNAITPNHYFLVRKSTQLFLAFDAVRSPEPRWKTYQATLEEDIDAAEGILSTNNQRELKRRIQKIVEDYELVRPAIIVSKPVTAATKMDSLLVFLQDQTEPSKIREGLKNARELVRIIFLGKDEDVLNWKGPLQEIPTGFILFVSGLIASVLTYVSWRKYWERKAIP